MTAKEEAMVKECMGLVIKLSGQFYGVDKEDLIQAGSLAVVKALRNYKNNQKVKFSTYAYDYIYGEMFLLAHNQKPVKVSRDYLKAYQLIEKTRYALAQKLGYVPDYDYVATYLGKDVAEVSNIVLAGSIMVSSLDKSQEDERSIYEKIPSEETLSIDEKLNLKMCMESLSEEEQKIITYHYFEDLPQREIARRLNMTQVMVSRYEKKGIDKMKEYYVQR